MIFGKQESCIWLGPMVADIQAPDIGGRPPRLTTSGGPMIVVQSRWLNAVGQQRRTSDFFSGAASARSKWYISCCYKKPQLESTAAAWQKPSRGTDALSAIRVSLTAESYSFSTVKLHLYHCTAKAKASLRTGAETVSPSVTPWQNSYILSTILEGLFCSNQVWILVQARLALEANPTSRQTFDVFHPTFKQCNSVERLGS